MRFPLACAALLTLSACGDDEQTPAPQEPTPPVAMLNGCETADYVDRSEQAADRIINFGGEAGSPPLGYSPSCILISAGQAVTFQGNFNTHPMSPGTVEGSGESLNTPVQKRGTGSDPYQVTFPTAGLYPYYCDYHRPTMIGVVRVK